MEAILPQSRERARLVNAGVMELGALVCTARTPRCEACPIASACTWRTDGYPPFEGRPAAVQKKFEGSDRQVRGRIMALLRASELPVTPAEIAVLWPDATQRDRALAGLLRDGLAVGTESSGYALPE